MEGIKSISGEIAIDTGASFVPGLLGARTAYKRIRFERNVNEAIEETVKRVNEIEKNLEFKTDEQRENLDELFPYILDFIADEPQKGKIQYFINGFVNLTEHETTTEDFVLKYYDLMSELRLIDLAVLRIYNKTIFLHDEESETYVDVMEKHGITYEQYESVRSNLFIAPWPTNYKNGNRIHE